MMIPTDKKLEQFSVKGTPLQFATGDGEWQPNADMVAMKNICLTDKQDGYTYKVLQTLPAFYVYNEIVVPSGCAVKTSDGKYYTANAKHIWDASKDIPSKVYPNAKNRWIITYYPTQNTPIQIEKECIYTFLDGVIAKNNPYSPFRSHRSIQYVEGLNGGNIDRKDECFYQAISLIAVNLDFSDAKSLQKCFSNCHSLIMFDKDLPNVTDLDEAFKGCGYLTYFNSKTPKCLKAKSVFYGCNNLRYIYGLDLSLVEIFNDSFDRTLNLCELKANTKSGKTFNSCFEYDDKLQTLEIDLTNAESLSFSLLGCSNLEFVKFVSIKHSIDLSVSTKFSKTTLVDDVLNVLVDLTGQAQQTLTLGDTNLAKLSEEDKAIATNKNWILK